MFLKAKNNIDKNGIKIKIPAGNPKLNINSIGRLWACPFQAPVISFI